MALVLDHGNLSRPAEAPFGTARRSIWSQLTLWPAPAPTTCPWGAINHCEDIAPGILRFHTAERSGYRLSPSRQRALPRALRTEDGWYEDSVEWAAVAVIFDRIFERIFDGAGETSLYHAGKETLRNWRPAEYESWFQTEIAEADIDELAVSRFHHLYADRWIVLDIRDDRHPFVPFGFVHARAKLGGDPPFGVRGRPLDDSYPALLPNRWFLVDAAEFTRGRGKPFLIDPDRHPAVETLQPES